MTDGVAPNDNLALNPSQFDDLVTDAHGHGALQQ